MFLYINTSDCKKVILALIDKKGRILKLRKAKAEYQQSEKLLSLIEKLLSGAKVCLPGRQAPSFGVSSDRSLKGVIVVTGPGGFTSLRIGIATANAMAWALQIPIVGVKNNKNEPDSKLVMRGFKKIIRAKRFKQVLPEYGKEPNITILNT